MKKTNIALIFFVIAAGIFFAWAAFAPHPSENGTLQESQQAVTSSSSLAAQTNTDGNVQVTVQPTDLQSAEWSFSVVMNTHSVDLPKDLMQSATLTDGSGNKIASLRWVDGALSSMPDHHHSGTLVFSAPASKPQSIILVISNVGGIPTRTFSWNLE
jgi:hypothetical protein